VEIRHALADAGHDVVAVSELRRAQVEQGNPNSLIDPARRVARIRPTESSPGPTTCRTGRRVSTGFSRCWSPCSRSRRRPRCSLTRCHFSLRPSNSSPDAESWCPRMCL
jgi:hypothetical protein